MDKHKRIKDLSILADISGKEKLVPDILRINGIKCEEGCKLFRRIAKTHWD